MPSIQIYPYLIIFKLFFTYLRFPKVPLHIHVSISFKSHAFFLQQGPLATPSRCRTSLFVHHPMTRQILSPRRISQCPSYHPRMARPSRQYSYMSVGCHHTTRNLSDNVQHIFAKPPCLLCRHLIGIVLHTSGLFISLALPRRVYIAKLQYLFDKNK